MTISTHLNFDGRCLEALEFYAQIFRGRITFKMTYGESPMASKMPPGWDKKIIHATLEIEGRTLSAADAPQGYYKKPQGFSVAVDIADPKDAETVFNVLSEDAKIDMPLQETFWAQRFGMLTDRFGTPWMINCGNPR